MDGLQEVATRLADEGVPVAVIARATRISTSDIWDQLYDAWYQGKLVGLPRNDWPPGMRRKSRTPGFAKIADSNEDHLLNALIGVFAITRTEARVLLTLIERHDVSNDAILYHCMPDCSFSSLRVYMHSLRDKLETFGLKIETIWGYGKRMPAQHRRRALDLLLKELETQELQKIAK